MGLVTRILSTVVMLALLLSSGVAAPVAAVGEVTVSINAPANVTSGGNFTATVDISTVVNLDAFNYDVSFDPTVLEITDPIVLEATDPIPDYSIMNVYGQINGTTIPLDIISLFHAGSGPTDPRVITVVQNVPGLGGVSGSGYLTRLHFHVIGSPGHSSNISLSDGVLSNNLAGEIPAAWIGDSVYVSGLAVTTKAATNITTSSATLNGRLDSRGDYSSANVSFEWGLTHAYGNVTSPQTMTSTANFSAPISGLSANTTYYFRAKAAADSATVHGAELSFTTPIIDVLRNLPAVVGKGQTFDVTVTFTATANGFIPGITDYAPSGWSVSVNATWCTPAPLDCGATNNKAEFFWTPYAKDTAFTVLYKVTVPSSATPGTYSFTNGVLDYLIGADPTPFLVGILGDSQVEVVEGARIQGATYEVKGIILGGVTLTLDSQTSVASDGQGNYLLTASTTGSYTVVASKTGYRNQTRTVNVTDLTAIYQLDFKGNYGLVPNSVNVSYVLACIQKWKFGTGGLQINVSKMLAVIQAWKFPIT